MKYLLCYEVPFKTAEGQIAGHATFDLKHGLTVKGIADACADILAFEQPRNRAILSHVVLRSATKLDLEPNTQTA